jgi:signal transduction histidine kinase
LRGPILGIRELIKLTNEGIVSKEEFFGVLPDISKNMDAVSVLLENLLAWTSSQLKGEVIEKKMFDLAKVLDLESQLFEKIAKEKGVTIKLEKSGSLYVYADKNMIDLVIRNLISNAIKFSKKDDAILVIAQEVSDHIEILISDTGIGISQENLLKLNNGESFTTVGQNKEQGTGLGILLVRDYIRKNNGDLLIESTINEGSAFSFSLPKFSLALTEAQL